MFWGEREGLKSAVASAGKKETPDDEVSVECWQCFSGTRHSQQQRQTLTNLMLKCSANESSAARNEIAIDSTIH